MTFLNESRSDRALRMLGGLVLLSAAWTVSLTPLDIMLFTLGGIAVVTGIAGWCPAYTLLGVATLKRPAGHCPNCDTGHRQG